MVTGILIYGIVQALKGHIAGLGECIRLSFGAVETTLNAVGYFDFRVFKEVTDLDQLRAVLEVAPTALATPADLGLGHERSLSGLGLFDLTLTPAPSE